MKRYEYYIALTGGGKYSGGISTEVFHPYFDHEITFNDIVAIQEYVSNENDNYVWNVTFVMLLSTIEAKCTYLVTYKICPENNSRNAVTETARLHLNKPFKDHQKDEIYQLFQCFLDADTGFQFDIEIISATLEPK